MHTDIHVRAHTHTAHTHAGSHKPGEQSNTPVVVAGKLIWEIQSFHVSASGGRSEFLIVEFDFHKDTRYWHKECRTYEMQVIRHSGPADMACDAILDLPVCRWCNDRTMQRVFNPALSAWRVSCSTLQGVLEDFSCGAWDARDGRTRWHLIGSPTSRWACPLNAYPVLLMFQCHQWGSRGVEHVVVTWARLSRRNGRVWHMWSVPDRRLLWKTLNILSASVHKVCSHWILCKKKSLLLFAYSIWSKNWAWNVGHFTPKTTVIMVM